jgi:hypothetical protein
MSSGRAAGTELGEDEEKKCRGSFAEGPRHPGLSCPPPQWANKKLFKKAFPTQSQDSGFFAAAKIGRL